MRRLLVRIAFTTLCLTPLLAARGGDFSVRADGGTPQIYLNKKPLAPFGDALVRVWLDPEKTAMSMGSVLHSGEAGIHLHTVEPLRPGLAWPDSYHLRDYSYLDRIVDGILTRDREAVLLIRLNMTDISEEWADRNAGEMARGEDEKRLGWPSLGSKKWQDELKAELKLLGEHVNNAPYSSRVAGFLLTGMHNGEWRYESLQAADFSPAGLADYSDWLKKRYGNVENLRAAWQESAVTFARAEPPRSSAGATAATTQLLNPSAAGARRQIDYRIYSSQRIEETIDGIAGRLASSSGKLIGANYGHIFELAPNEDFAALGHGALGNLLNSSNIDFVAAPMPYDGRDPFSFGPYSSGPLEAVRESGKLYLTINDMRTHLAEPSPLRFSYDMQQTIGALNRDLSRSLVSGSGQVLFDAELKNWFDAPEIWKTYGRLREVYTKALESNAVANEPQVAVILDEKSLPYFASGPDLALPLLFGQRADIARAGFSYGYYLQSRLKDIPESARVFLFLDAFAVDRKEIQAIHKEMERRKAVAVWLFAPGLIQENGFDPAIASELTGLRLSADETAFRRDLAYGAQPDPLIAHMQALPPARLPALSPTVFALPGQGRMLAQYAQNEAFTAIAGVDMPGGWSSMFSAHPQPGVGFLRGVASQAGCHMWTRSENLAIYPGKYLLQANCLQSGEYAFSLPARAASVQELLVGQPVAFDPATPNTFTATLQAGQSYLFFFPPPPPAKN